MVLIKQLLYNGENVYNNDGVVVMRMMILTLVSAYCVTSMLLIGYLFSLSCSYYYCLKHVY